MLKALGLRLAKLAVLVLIPVVSGLAAETSSPNGGLPAGSAAATQTSPVHLYFAARNSDYLTAEQRVVLHPDRPEDLASAIINGLIKGPERTLLRTIPAGTRLRALYITPDGICYVDLSPAVRQQHPGGSKSELLTIFSMVNSLVLNVPEIERVQFLIDGQEVLTLAGHIDLQLPVKANMLLTR